jgi:hypothetical protein
MTHWHVGTGLRGYGFDAETVGSYENAWQAGDAIGELLDRLGDSLMENAHSFAGMGEYKAAWDCYLACESLDREARNVSSERADAPLYHGDLELWSAEAARLIERWYPWAYSDHSPTTVHAWHCTEPACELDPEGWAD